MKLLNAVRTGNSSNHFAMATLYRQNLDRQPPGDAQRSLAAVAAYEYQRGLEVNPFRHKIRGCLADLLEQHPEAAEIAGISTSAAELRLLGAQLGPTYISAHMAVARSLPIDLAYTYLVTHALPWSELKYDGYHAPRQKFLSWLATHAAARDDEDVLRVILAKLERQQTLHDENTTRRGYRARLCQGSWRHQFGC